MKIGFVLLSPAAQPISSTRIAVLNMLPYLRRAGFDADIIFEPVVATPTPTLNLSADRLADQGYRVVCFQKVTGGSVLSLVRALSDKGIRSIFVVCDFVYAEMAEATDATFVVTEFLRSLYPAHLHSKIHVVPDGIERPEMVKTQWRADSGSRANPLHAVLVTSAEPARLSVLRSPPSWLRVSVVGRYLPYRGVLRWLRDTQWTLRQQVDLRTLIDAYRFRVSRRVARVPWSAETVYEHMRAADIGIIPIDTSVSASGANGVPDWMVKSENRLTMKMAIGLPVIATPIPAYEHVIAQGQSGFFARSRSDWLTALESLRDPVLRRQVGCRARDSVIDGYSKEVQAAKWSSLLRQLHATDRAETVSGGTQA